MAARSRTYAIRLAVEGGGQVKAELVSVGQSGEQSLKCAFLMSDNPPGLSQVSQTAHARLAEVFDLVE